MYFSQIVLCVTAFIGASSLSTSNAQVQIVSTTATNNGSGSSHLGIATSITRTLPLTTTTATTTFISSTNTSVPFTALNNATTTSTITTAPASSSSSSSTASTLAASPTPSSSGGLSSCALNCIVAAIASNQTLINALNATNFNSDAPLCENPSILTNITSCLSSSNCPDSGTISNNITSTCQQLNSNSSPTPRTGNSASRSIMGDAYSSSFMLVLVVALSTLML